MTEPAPAHAPADDVRAVRRALRLAALVARSEAGLSLSHLARAAELPVATASRLLATLVREGMAERTAAGHYRAGAQLARIGLDALQRFGAHRLSVGHLERLVAATGETASLAVQVNDAEAVYLRQLHGPRSLRLDSWAGRRLPLDGTATGSALRNALGSEDFVVRRHPDAVGYTAVASPVRDGHGRVAAALTVAAPTSRVGDAELRRIGRLVARQARAASTEIVSLTPEEMSMLQRYTKPLIALALAVSASAATAQAFPSKPVLIVNAYAAGGPTDVVARAVAQKLQEAWGQTVIVESKPGANGAIGIKFVAAAPADGHTLIVMPIGNAAIIPYMAPDIGYDIDRDFVPVSLMANVENILAVNTQTPARTMPELLALAKARPGQLTFSSPGQGSLAHVGVELLKASQGAELLHVPYKGVAPALNDVVGGHITMILGQASSILPMVKSGKLTAIGVASARRSPSAPEIPTIAEQGVPGFEVVAWYGLMAPAGTPREVVAKIAAETARALQDKGVRERFAALGVEAVGNTPEEFAVIVKRDRARWSELVKRQKLKFD